MTYYRLCQKIAGNVFPITLDVLFLYTKILVNLAMHIQFKDSIQEYPKVVILLWKIMVGSCFLTISNDVKTVFMASTSSVFIVVISQATHSSLLINASSSFCKAFHEVRKVHDLSFLFKNAHSQNFQFTSDSHKPSSRIFRGSLQHTKMYLQFRWWC